MKQILNQSEAQRATLNLAPVAEQLTLCVLGPAQITLNRTPLRAPYDKVLALLAYLAIESDSAHRRSTLASLLWPDQAEQVARHSLSQALFSLRRVLHEDPANPFVIATRETIRLSPDAQIWCDLVAFRTLQGSQGDHALQRYEDALALYRGDVLTGFNLGDSAAFEEWLLHTREQTHAQVCNLLDILSGPEAAAQSIARACDHARQWVAHEPLAEQAHRRLMRLLSQHGQRGAALLHYEQCRALLQAELGIEPDSETTALYEELKHTAPRVGPSPASLTVQHPIVLPSTRLIDRIQELADLTMLLANPSHRLITITGPGGVGKTRIALHAAARTHSFGDGVAMVSFAPIREPALVLPALAQALGIQTNAARGLEQLLIAALRQKHMLLLLDNCEHVIPALVALIPALLAAAPRLVILATSRVALRLTNEHLYLLAPLSVPDSYQLADAELAQSPAVALFVERAQAVRPSMTLEYAAIAAICRQLDGLPLAIELAATRARLLNPSELLRRLDQRLALLRGGPRDLPERHQTLRDAIDWSYQLLTPAEQTLFRRLAVFAGGWSVAAAEVICADMPEEGSVNGIQILEGLSELLDASLITQIPTTTAEARCTMLETIREYALERLEAAGELMALQNRHAAYAAQLADQAKTALTSADGACWTQHLIAEHDNARAAMRWSLDHGHAELALRIGRGIWRFWWRSGFGREGLDWLRAALAQGDAGDPYIRAEALRAAGVLAWAIDDFSQAHSWLAQGLEQSRGLRDHGPEAAIYTMLGILSRAEGALEQAHHYFQRSFALSSTLADPYAIRFAIMGLAEIDTRLGNLDSAVVRYTECIRLNAGAGDMEGVAAAKRRLANSYVLLGRASAEAAALCAESLQLCRAMNDKQGLSQTLLVLGNLARNQGDDATALPYYRESLELRMSLEKHEDCVQTLEALAACLATAAHHHVAAQLLGATSQLRQQLQAPLTSFEQGLVKSQQESLRMLLGVERFDSCWRAGLELSAEQAFAMALDATANLTTSHSSAA